MRKNNTYSCPSCNTLHVIQLEQSSLLVCKSCGEIIQDRSPSGKPPRTRVPEDWSFLQLGSTGQYQKQPFKIIGRIRLQLRNDYKNFWCAEYSNGKCLWLAESFASFSLFTADWKEYDKEANKLRAGTTIKLSSDEKLKGEYVEKCEGISYQGEAGPWKIFTPGFFVVQASAQGGKTAIFIVASGSVEYVSGVKVSADTLKFQNIITWNEWK